MNLAFLSTGPLGERDLKVLRRTVETLAPVDRVLLCARAMGTTYEQLAAEFGVSPPAMRLWVREIRARVHASLPSSE